MITGCLGITKVFLGARPDWTELTIGNELLEQYCPDLHSGRFTLPFSAQIERASVSIDAKNNNPVLTCELPGQAHRYALILLDIGRHGCHHVEYRTSLDYQTIAIHEVQRGWFKEPDEYRLMRLAPGEFFYVVRYQRKSLLSAKLVAQEALKISFDGEQVVCDLSR